MALIDLWNKDRNQLTDKHIQQVIVFAGDGKLRDNSIASDELRSFLRNVPSDMLEVYTNQCLHNSFTDSGFALQDLVNEIGRRLDFSITHGRYRGVSGQIGNDGLWRDGEKHSIIVEVKTTDTYRIDLDSIAHYRQLLANEGIIKLEASSMLIVVGRQDTGDLEAQIRGSRHAWDMRVISVEALIRILKLKEDIEDPLIITRIHEILIPREFTRLDPIIEIAFAAVEDIKEESVSSTFNDVDTSKKFTPVAFHSECIKRIESFLNTTLIKQTRASFCSYDESIRVLCSVSRYHEKGKNYWFAFHPHQNVFLKNVESSYVAFGCGDENTLFLIPFSDFEPFLDHLNKTVKPDRYYWHVIIHRSGKSFVITSKAGVKNIDITKYML